MRVGLDVGGGNVRNLKVKGKKTLAQLTFEIKCRMGNFLSQQTLYCTTTIKLKKKGNSVTFQSLEPVMRGDSQINSNERIKRKSSFFIWNGRQTVFCYFIGMVLYTIRPVFYDRPLRSPISNRWELGPKGFHTFHCESDRCDDTLGNIYVAIIGQHIPLYS